MAVPSTVEATQDASLAVQKQESQARAIFRRFLRNKAAVVSSVILLVLYAIALLAPVLAKQPIDFLDVVQRNISPNWEHPFGTDSLGRDVLSRMIFNHILRNAAAPIIVSATLRIGGAILTESSLSFLGLGTPPPATSWGPLLSMGRQYLRQAPHVAIWPGVAILITVLAFNYVGDGLRDALDPKMKR